jgi:hypothetical protein
LETSDVVGRAFLPAAGFQAAHKRYRTGRRSRLPHIILLFIALSVTGCKGKREPLVVHNDEEQVSLASTIKMGDAASSNQLISGFYGIESGAWRWTAGKFSAELAVPVAAGQKGGTLTFDFAFPDVVKQHLNKVTMTASIDGNALNSSTYEKAGPAVYTADVPAGLLSKDTVKVDFSLDNSLAPKTVGDARELGVVANSLSLSSK